MIAFLVNLRDQLIGLWKSSTPAWRITFVTLAVVSLLLIVGTGIWSARPHYVTLASNLGPTEAAELVSRLSAQGIRHQLSFSGSSVLVPQNHWNEARLLAGELVSPGSLANEPFEDSLLGDPSLNHYKMLRRREESLSRTIMRISPIKSATVHIGQPDPTPFVRDQAPTTASVVVELKPGATLSREQASAIVAMVAGSVEGLRPDQVTVLDTQGRILSASGVMGEPDIAHQLEYRRRLESDLAWKAEHMLAEMLGEGKAIVRVTADIDFTQTERTETYYDPEAKVKRREKITNTSSTQAQLAGVGPAGTASNLTPTGGASQNGPFTQKEETNETEYETGKTVDTIKEASGTIKRLTVAAMVELPTPAGATANSGGAAPGAINQQDIEAIVKQAVGFDPQRNDEIEVLLAPLHGPSATANEALVKMEKWELFNQLARNGSLGVAALAALIITWLISRKLRPIPVPSNPLEQLSADRMRTLAELAVQAQQNPEAVSTLLGAWLGGEGTAAAGKPAVTGAQVRRPAA